MEQNDVLKKISQNQLSLDFIRTLAQTTGNKVYLRSIQSAFEKLAPNLTGEEMGAFRFLLNDLRALKQDADRKKRF